MLDILNVQYSIRVFLKILSYLIRVLFWSCIQEQDECFVFWPWIITQFCTILEHCIKIERCIKIVLKTLLGMQM